jgi:hypothetical protein
MPQLIAAPIIAALGLGAVGAAVVTFAVNIALTLGVSKLLSKRAGVQGDAGGSGGGRVQIPPATDNKIPVVYGSAFVGGPIIDAKISTDQKTMWYVIALAEHQDDQGGGGGSYTFGDIYYDGKLVTFSSGAAVASLTTNTTPAQTDSRVADNLFIYLFTNGSSSGVNTGGQTAIDILSDPQIPSALRWTSTDTMTNCAFAIVKVIYNADKGVVNCGALTAQLTSTITKPGDAILDYLLNTRYGCAIPLSRIDTTSLTDLNTYSDQTITYYQGATPLTQPRYRINGPLDTAQNCLNNLQRLVDSCDSWLQYSELTGKWKVVINQSYTDYTTLNNLYLVDDNNLISGLVINPIDLNDTYNQVEVAYPNRNIKDQTDYQILDLTDSSTAWYDPTLLSPNEAINRLNVQLPLVNEAVQAKYLGVRRLLQSREDLAVSFTLDYSGIQIEAGDVIRITFAPYGWTDKLFRVSNVTEEKDQSGNLYAGVQAFEYNDTIYNDNAIQDYVPAFNTGLTDPNVLYAPTVPVVANGAIANNGINSFSVSSNVSSVGTVLYMDFNYGNSSNVQQHKRYSSVNASVGNVLVANSTITINVSDLPAGNYYWSATARNKFAGNTSAASSPFAWGGPSITPPSGNGGTGPGGVTGNVVQSNTISSNNMTTTGVTAGCYTYPSNVCVDAAGRITSIANGTGGGILTIQDTSVNVVSNVSILNFTGNGVNVSNANGIANIDITAVGGYMQVADNQLITLYGDNGTNAFSTVVRALSTYRVPAQLEFVNSGGSITTQAYTLGTDDYYPWFTNTSSTTNNFWANTTLRLQPVRAAYQQINVDYTGGTTLDGYEGWIQPFYGAIDSTFTLANNSTDTTYLCDTSVQLVSDANITVQVGGTVEFSWVANNNSLARYVNYGTVTTLDLIAKRPQTVNLSFTEEGYRVSNVSGNLYVSEMGIAVRNPDSGNVFIVSGNLKITVPTNGPTY